MRDRGPSEHHYAVVGIGEIGEPGRDGHVRLRCWVEGIFDDHDAAEACRDRQSEPDGPELHVVGVLPGVDMEIWLTAWAQGFYHGRSLQLQ